MKIAMPHKYNVILITFFLWLCIYIVRIKRSCKIWFIVQYYLLHWQVQPGVGQTLCLSNHSSAWPACIPWLQLKQKLNHSFNFSFLLTSSRFAPSWESSVCIGSRDCVPFITKGKFDVPRGMRHMAHLGNEDPQCGQQYLCLGFSSAACASELPVLNFL